MAETIGESHHEHRNMAALLDFLEARLAVYRDGGVGPGAELAQLPLPGAEVMLAALKLVVACFHG